MHQTVVPVLGMCRLRIHAACLAAFLVSAPACATIVRFETVLGNFDVRLYESATPAHVANFLGYVNRGDYTDSLVHRTVPGFVVQGGGWRYDGTAQVEPQDYPLIPTQPPAPNEPGVSNLRGTIALAKQADNPSSGTNQWFVNLADNSANLDNQNGGFTVFGRVLGDGMDVVDAIAALPRYGFLGAWETAPMRNYTVEEYNAFVPVDGDNLVIIEQVSVLNLAPGDYDFDGDVDSDDYAVLATTFGSPTDARADGNGDGIVNGADYVVWRESYAGAAVSAPEPSSAALVALAAALGRRKRNRAKCGPRMSRRHTD